MQEGLITEDEFHKNIQPTLSHVEEFTRPLEIKIAK